MHGPMPIKGRFGSTDKKRSSVDHPDPKQPRTGESLLSSDLSLCTQLYTIIISCRLCYYLGSNAPPEEIIGWSLKRHGIQLFLYITNTEVKSSQPFSGDNWTRHMAHVAHPAILCICLNLRKSPSQGLEYTLYLPAMITIRNTTCVCFLYKSRSINSSCTATMLSIGRRENILCNGPIRLSGPIRL